MIQPFIAKLLLKLFVCFAKVSAIAAGVWCQLQHTLH